MNIPMIPMSAGPSSGFAIATSTSSDTSGPDALSRNWESWQRNAFGGHSLPPIARRATDCSRLRCMMGNGSTAERREGKEKH